MGLFKKLFSGGARCGASGCGRSVKPPDQMMTIFTTDIDRFSIGGMSGYCPLCGEYRCSDHLKFQPADASGMAWEIGCTLCGCKVQPRP